MKATYNFLKSTAIKTPLMGRAGQVAVEYVLLLAVGVVIAALITNLVVSRSDDSPGFLISKWKAIITLIGADPIEK